MSISIRLTNPRLVENQAGSELFDVESEDKYLVDVEFSSDTPDQVVGEGRIRFLVDQYDFKGTVNFVDFVAGYGVTKLPKLHPGKPASKIPWSFKGNAGYVGGKFQLLDKDDSVALTAEFTRLFSIELPINNPNDCPAIVLDRKFGGGGFMKKEGISVTPLPQDRTGTTTNVEQFNWEYDPNWEFKGGSNATPYSGKIPFGKPVCETSL